MFRHTRIKYPAPRTCRFVVQRPDGFMKLVHFLINDIDQISGLSRPPANFGSENNPTCPSHPSTTFPQFLTIFGSISQGVNNNRGSVATFCDRRSENEVKSECFLHPQFTFIPTQCQVNMYFKTHVNADGGDATNNQSGGGGGCFINHCSNGIWKWSEYFLHPQNQKHTHLTQN